MTSPKPFASGTTIVATQPSNPRSLFLATGDAMTVLAERTAQVDRMVMDAACQWLFPALPTGLAVLAVGGYGRRHLFPYSDIDLLLLVEDEDLAHSHKDAISAFLQRLWDAGLRLSHSVRTPAECAEVHDNNIELNVSLLDQRFLAGDRALYADLARRMPRFVAANREALVENLARLTHERHSKYANTIYHLEPNVKDTPGGLRDYQLVCWLEAIDAAGARMAAPGPAPELREAMLFLARLRCYLHVESGRDNNVLSFDAQDALADHWGQRDPAQWMRQYYRHARAIYRAALRRVEAHEAQSSSLLAQFRDWRSRLANADFSVHRDRAHFRSPQHLDLEPELVLRIFEFVARHGVALSAEAEQQIEARLAGLRTYFRSPQPVWPLLKRVFSLPHAPLAARLMHETGVLAALFPEMEWIECLVVRDFFHRYTVDEHSLVAIENLWNLGTPQYRDLLAEVREPGVLLFALLFHDTGKGLPNEAPVDGSLRLAAAAMERVRMPQGERDLTCFLIRRHLDLSAAMQSRDLFDPPTILEVARQVETVERLKALTLITYADISAVNPTVMTPWRAQQLWQLYTMVYNALTRELESDRIAGGRTEETAAAFGPERAAFLEGFPTRYLRTHTHAAIDAHMALRDRGRGRGVAVDVERADSAWRLTLVAADQPGLFASVAGTLSSFGMDILKAEAFSNRRGLVLDTFTFADPHRTLELNPSEVERLRMTTEKVLLRKADVRELLRNRPKPRLPSRTAGIQTRVAFDSEAGATATLVEIVAQDRPGLLYDLASAMSLNGCNIEVVLIDTQAHKAIDVFYVTAEGRKLAPGKLEVLKEALENACQTG
jgi:[protein-PII] uridylyltransferase